MTLIGGTNKCYSSIWLFMFPGTENVQGAQKFITGLDARRLSKYPELRYIASITYCIYIHLFKCTKRME